jgi:preprotein translocase subunit SecE
VKREDLEILSLALQNDRNIMSRIVQFFREVRVELGKVVWPSRREALKSTGIVVLFCFIVAVFLGIVDFGLARLIGLIVG